MNSIKKDLTYSDAMKRLEEIVRKIESGEMDIDSLAENLKEAKQLVAFCKGKLQHVEDEVNKIMEGKE
ncbi:MAG: exodeoxyribonuclease VII small subunit [Bacteroidaceae bacterium]|jgi:exodeoxyribonuclease VII small subunit